MRDDPTDAEGCCARPKHDRRCDLFSVGTNSGKSQKDQELDSQTRREIEDQRPSFIHRPVPFAYKTLPQQRSGNDRSRQIQPENPSRNGRHPYGLIVLTRQRRQGLTDEPADSDRRCR